MRFYKRRLSLNAGCGQFQPQRGIANAFSSGLGGSGKKLTRTTQKFNGQEIHRVIADNGRFYPDDIPSGNIPYQQEQFNTEDEARQRALSLLGKPVYIGPGKWRNTNGNYQMRGKPNDINDPNKPHIHFEVLNPDTGEVKQNIHIVFKVKRK